MVVLIVVPKLLLHPFCLPPFSYVVNECCMKSLRPAFFWKWTYLSVLRATTTTMLELQSCHLADDSRRRAVLPFFVFLWGDAVRATAVEGGSARLEGGATFDGEGRFTTIK